MTQPWAPPLLVTPQRDVVITPQQAKVLSGLCRGWTFDRIAHDLFISTNTAKRHSERLYGRMGATSRAHAVALACTGQVRVLVYCRAPTPKWRATGEEMREKAS